MERRRSMDLMKTENHNSKYIIVYDKDITYVISKPKRLESIYMLLFDLTLPKITGTSPCVIKLFPPKNSSQKNQKLSL